MAHEGVGNDLPYYFIPNETVQSNLEEEINNIKWFWPYSKIIHQLKTNPPIYVIPFECKIPTKEDFLSRSMVAYDFLYKEKMIFYKEIYRDGVEIIDFCTPLAFISQFLPQEK